MDFEVVAARKGTVASRHPADIGLFLRVTPCMALEVVLTLEAHSAANDVALEFSLVYIKFLVLGFRLMIRLLVIDMTVRQ
jgi:hypothetical protein